ncbi:MAG: hypothetical protein ACN6NX_05530 [Acinetobacter sp.]
MPYSNIIFTAKKTIAFSVQPNDGLARKCSAKLKLTIHKDYKWSCIEEVTQLLGLKSFLALELVAVFRKTANRVRQQDVSTADYLYVKSLSLIDSDSSAINQ